MNLETFTSSHEKIFVTQYTAVLMIILTFVVGAFARPHQPMTPPPIVLIEGTGKLPAIEGPLPPSVPNPIGTMTFTNIFRQGTNEIDSEQLEGVVAALHAHDIGVRFQITVAAAETERTAAESALIARLVSSYRWLEALHIPPQAYQVEGEIGAAMEAPQLTVEFIGGVRE